LSAASATPADHSAFSTDIDVFFDGTEVEDREVISFMVQKNYGQPDMAVITLRNDDNKHTIDRNHAQSVEIKAGGSSEGAEKVSIFKGEIWSIEPVYKAQGDSRVVIRAFNKMRRLLQGRKSKTFQSQSDQDVVGALVGDAGLTADSGDDPKITYDHLYQHAQTNLEFIRSRAARIGFEVWCEDTTLYFKKPDMQQDSGIELKLNEAGEHHLKVFAARLSSANVLKKVTVQGWDPKKKEQIVGDAEAENTPLGSKNAAEAAGDLGQTMTFVCDHPIFSVEEAQAIAKSKLAEANHTYITAEATCRGNGAYKLGIRVKVIVNSQTESDRFNGYYEVAGVCHRFSPGKGGQPGGFESILELRRDGQEP
jgi:hypothetical protein